MHLGIQQAKLFLAGSLALSENSVVGHGECQRPTGTASNDIAPPGSTTGAGLKRVAEVRPQNGRVRSAELHWYEAHGSGRRKMKIKTFVIKSNG